MRNKLSSKLKFKIIGSIIILGIIIIPDVINYLRFGYETQKKIEFVQNNPDKLSGKAHYTNYEGKNKEGTVEVRFFNNLIDLMQKKNIKDFRTATGHELYSVEIFYGDSFFLNCTIDYRKFDNNVEIVFDNANGYNKRMYYEVTETEMEQFYNSIITISNQWNVVVTQITDNKKVKVTFEGLVGWGKSRLGGKTGFKAGGANGYGGSVNIEIKDKESNQ